eukprot:403374775
MNSNSSNTNARLTTPNTRNSIAEASPSLAKNQSSILKSPSQQKSLMSSTLKDLKQTYQQMESQIVESTKKQRQDQLDKHKNVLGQIDALKQFLKSEEANRKQTELHFNDLIDNRITHITEQFNIQYLNQMYEMRDQINRFENRQRNMEGKGREIQAVIEDQLEIQRQQLVQKVQSQQQEFGKAYQQQISADLQELKYIGELEYNFDNMLKQINSNRSTEYTELQQMIENGINDKNVYENQEKTRKILFQEINSLKNRCKLEVDSRKQADEDIQNALDKYQELIQREVETKRQEIRQKN